MLDQEQLETAGVPIGARVPGVMSSPKRAGNDVADELGGRYLVRYLAAAQLTEFLSGSSRPHWATPTAYGPDDLHASLALWDASVPREHVLLLNPRHIEEICGPAFVRCGPGIEYYLPGGFPKSAIVDVGVLPVT